MSHARRFVVAAVTLAGLLGAALAPAATFTVTNLTDGNLTGPNGSLRRAVSLANSSADATNTINFQGGLTGTITLTNGVLGISKTVTISGPGADLITISGNNASGILLATASNVTITVTNLTFANGRAGNGAAICNTSGGQLLATSCEFNNNAGTQFADGGGAICWRNGRITINGCTFANNTHVQGGGAINVTGAYNNATTVHAITTCTFVNNPNAVWTECADCGVQLETDLLNCTFSGNAAALYTTENHLNNPNGIAAAAYRNCIFAGPAPQLTANNGNVLNTSVGHCLSTDTTGGVPAAGDLQYTDPLLAPLDRYGGSTRTCVLLPGSPAIDAGDNSAQTATDQRGQNRIGAASACGSGTADIGAVETQVYVVSNTNDNTINSMRDAFARNNAAGGGIVCCNTSGTLTLTSGSLASGKPIDIRGPGASLLTVKSSGNDRVFALNTTARVSGLTIANGRNQPGGVFSAGGLTLDACRLTGNSSSGGFGGALRAYTGAVVVRNCTFDNNDGGGGSPSGGGAVWIDSSITSAAFTNCTFSNNAAWDAGGALYFNQLDAGAPIVNITNCTFADANVPVGGAIGGDPAFTVKLQNSIFATGAASNIAGVTAVSLGNNISTDASGNLTQPTDRVNANPRLAPLGNYGGATPTRALLRGSAAIDAANTAAAPTTDQRGAPRRSATCGATASADSGAFEFDPANYALTLNGTSQYVDCGYQAALALHSGFTLEARVRPSTIAGVARIVATGGPPGFGFGRNGGRVRFTTFGIQDFDTAGSYLTPGVWTHLAVTFDAAYVARFYVNGALVETIYGAAPAAVSTANFNLGRQSNGTEYWGGDLDEVRVWSVVRSAAEIQTTANAYLLGTESGLVGYWRLDEGAGTVAIDTAGGRNGALLSAPAWTSVATCQRGPVGDVNCDGALDFKDINPFVLALSNPASYAASFPGCDPRRADLNGDNGVDFKDINPFVAALAGN